MTIGMLFRVRMDYYMAEVCIGSLDAAELEKL